MSEDRWIGDDATSHILLDTPKIDQIIEAAEGNKLERPFGVYIAEAFKEIKEILTKLAAR